MRIAVIISFLNLCLAPSNAQVYFNEVYDDTTHGGEVSTNILLLADGSFLVPSGCAPPEGEEPTLSYNIRHISPEGEELAQDTVIDSQNYVIYVNLSEAFITTTDGSYLQASAKGGAYLLKLNSDLSVDWDITVDSLSTFYSAIELANGNYFVCGYTYDSNHINLFWISPSGVVLNHSYANPYPQSNFYNITRVEELINGDLLMSGFDVYGFDSNQIMIRTDSSGKILWQKELSYDFQDWTPYTVIENESTATAVFGHIDYVLNPDDIARDNFHGRLGTIEVDLETGDTSNVILYEPEMAFYWLTDFTKTPDNGYAALGWATLPTQNINYSFILKLGENRQQEWYKTYLHEPFDEDSTQIAQAWDFEVTADSGFVVAGHWDDVEMLGKQMPWVFKVDQCGDLVWSNCGADNIQVFNDSKIQRFKIAPNPANDVVNISSTQEFESIAIRDITGKLVYTSAIGNHVLQTQVDVSVLAKGIYLIEVDYGNGVICAQKLVVE